MSNLPPSRSRIWNAFLPLGDPRASDSPPVATAEWLGARGVGENAPRVLRLVREVVLPLVHDLEGRGLLESHSLLVHDRASGVPTTAEDHQAYLHLRLSFHQEVSAREILGPRWAWVSAVEELPADAAVHAILNQQCAWYLRLVESCAGLDDIEALQKIGQFLHYFANVSQMRIE